MANLKSGKVNGTGDYVNIENLFDIELTENVTYSIQVQGEAVVCEKSTKPTDSEGFYWNSLKPFGYKKESAYLWLKVKTGSSVFVNIAG